MSVRSLVDTGALLALSHRRDQNHDQAVAIADRHRSRGGTFVAIHRPGFPLVDAVSFEVMHREKVTSAFAFDHHFEIAGFELLR